MGFLLFIMLLQRSEHNRIKVDPPGYHIDKTDFLAAVLAF
jgi:hypothetical protein